MQGVQSILQGSMKICHCVNYSWRIDATYSIMGPLYEEKCMMIGEEIKGLRKLLGYTQAKLAEEIGVTPNTIARYERDEFKPSPPVQKLLKMLQMRVTNRKAA